RSAHEPPRRRHDRFHGRRHARRHRPLAPAVQRERAMSRQPVPLQVLTWPSKRELARRLPRLLAGIVVLGLGIAPILDAKLGVAPWDVLHQGLSEVTGLSFGLVVVLVGLVVLLAWIPLKQRAGIGTIINTLTVGFIVNGVLDVLPEVHNLAVRWAMLLGGI